MSDQKETADEIMQRYEREAEELRAKAQEELKGLMDAERAEGLVDRELRREQLYGAHAIARLQMLESRREVLEKWSGKESWLWAREEFLADGWVETKDAKGGTLWKRGDEGKRIE